MMKNKGKRLVVLLIAACMILSMFSGMTVSAATDAEIYATTDTIKKVDEKYYYVNASGKMDKKTGWKKVAGKYTYYVGSKGNVTVKITKGKYYKWSDGQFKKQPVKKNSTKTIKGKAFYVNKNGNIEKKTGWKKIAGKYAYYVNSNGVVSLKITGGNYQKWSNGQFKKQSLEKYNGKIITIGKKAFYVSEDKIVRKTGWKRVSGAKLSSITNPRGYYVGTKGSVLYKETAKGTYEITSVGKVSDKLMKNGWNGAVFVKNGKVQINKTVEISCYKNVFDKDGKRVVLKIEDGKIVRSDTGKAVGAGNYKVGSDNKKTTYVVDRSGQIKTSGTVTINGKTYTIGSSGKVNVQKPSNGGSDNDDPKKDDPGSKQHVCKWLVVLDKNQNPVQSNYKKHDTVMGTENQLIRDAWDEPIYAARKWLVCNTCSGELGIDDQDCAYENTAELDKHQDSVHHGGNHLVKKIIDYKHHDAEYADVPVIKKRAYEECDYTYKCTVCGDTMTEHVVWGDTGNSSACAYIPNKSGDMLYADGSGVCQVVTKNTPYGTIGIDLAEPAYLTLLKDHGFIK